MTVRSDVLGVLEAQDQGESLSKRRELPQLHRTTNFNTRIFSGSAVSISDISVANTLFLYSEMSALYKPLGGAHPMSVIRVCCYMCMNRAHTFVRRFATLYISLTNNDTGKKSIHQIIYILGQKMQNVMLILIVVSPCILMSTKLFCQQMHFLLKHKMLQFIFKISFHIWLLHVSVSSDHHHGAYDGTLLKLQYH